MLRRVLIVAACTIVVWLVLLAILGAALGGRQERHTQERLGESLAAIVTIGDSDLALVRGHLTLDQLAVRRDDLIGHLALDVASVRCELAPLGWALIDRDCRELSVRGVRLEVSTAALFKVKRPKRTPFHADRVVIEDAILVFLPNAFAPNLGRVEIAIDRAVTGRTVMRTPLSWLFSLQELRARLALPAGITLTLGYRAGVLTVAGALFGGSPVELPVTIPAAAIAGDAQEEMAMLVKLGKDIAEQLVAKRAADWLRSKLWR